jgi:hypothetical protein
MENDYVSVKLGKNDDFYPFTVYDAGSMAFRDIFRQCFLRL